MRTVALCVVIVVLGIARSDKGSPGRCNQSGSLQNWPYCVSFSRMANDTDVVLSVEREHSNRTFAAHFQFDAATFSQFHDCLNSNTTVTCIIVFAVLDDPTQFEYIPTNIKSSFKNSGPAYYAPHVWSCLIPKNPQMYGTENGLQCERATSQQSDCFQSKTCTVIRMNEKDSQPVEIQWRHTLSPDSDCTIRRLEIKFAESLCVRHCEYANEKNDSYCANCKIFSNQSSCDASNTDVPNTNNTDKSSTNNTDKSNTKSDSTGAIVGAVLGIIVIIVIIVIVVILVKRRESLREYLRTQRLCQMCPFFKETSQPSQHSGRLGTSNFSDSEKDEGDYTSVRTRGKNYEETDINFNANYSTAASYDQTGDFFDYYTTISNYGRTQHSSEDNKKKTNPTLSTNTINTIAGPDSSNENSDSPDYFTNKYSHLHEETRIPKNPYNVLLKPKEDPKHRQPIEAPSDANMPNQESFKYSVALSIEDVENIRSQPIDVVDTAGTSKATPRKFHIKEKSGGTEMEGNLDNDPQKEEHKYFELEREDSTAESEANAKNKRRAYFELEKVEEEENSDPSDSYY